MAYLKLLGGAVLSTDDGMPSKIAARRHPLALLALLATAASRRLSRGKLVGYLWPEVPESTARNRLTTAVHRIRADLGEAVLVNVGGDLQLTDSVLRCDAWEFQSALDAAELREAVSLYHGPFLDGFEIDHSRSFEEWVDHERERFRRELRRSLELLAEEAERNGSLDSAVHWWQTRADHDPHESPVVRRLMETLVAAGNRAEALRVAEAHERLLREEFGTALDPEMGRFIRDLRLPAGLAGKRTSEPQPGRLGNVAASRAATHPAPVHPVSPTASPLSTQGKAPAKRRTVRGVGVAVLGLTAVLTAVALGLGSAHGGGEPTAVHGPATAVSAKRLAAQELYLQAERARQIGPVTEERGDRVEELYRRALELDSLYAPAWAGLAGVYVGRAWTAERPSLWADSARIAAHRALALDPREATAYTRLGDSFWPTGGTEQQLAAYERALELEPAHRVAANNMVAMLALRGHLADALRWAEEADRRGSESPKFLQALAFTNSVIDRDPVAKAWLEEARARGRPLLEAEFWIALFHRGHPAEAREILDRLALRDHRMVMARGRGALALYERDWAEARRQYRTLFSGPLGASSPVFRGVLADQIGLAWALDRLGQQTEAAEIAADVAAAADREVRAGSRSSRPRERLAVASLLLGDTAAALHWLDEAVDHGFRDLRLAHSLPLLDPLRHHPSFHAWIDRLERLQAVERERAEANELARPRADLR